MIILCTIFRTGTEIIKCIVHPSHIPFIVETKPALRNRISNLREGSGIFCCKDCRRVELFQSLVHILEKLYGVEIYTACRITLPVDRTADCIHADSIHMELTHPIVGTGLKEASCLTAGVHEIAASPFTDTYGRVWIFIKGCSVIICQTIGIHCKVDRNKVHQNTDPMFMAGIHKGF